MTAMTATAAPTRARSGGALTGTGTLLRFMLRRDRIRLPVWLIAISIFVPYFFSAFEQLFPTQADLAQMASFTTGPMLGLLGGPGYGLDPEQLNFFTFFTGLYLLYILLAAALMNILLVSRHTRVEEQTGRAELVRANVVGAHAPLAATTIVAVAANLVLAVLVLAGLRAYDAPMAGAVAVAAGTGAFGLVFAGVSIAAVQISEYSRTSSAIAGGILGGAFVLRAAGDMIGEHGSALSWITPFAWSQQTRAFVDERWWPLGISVLVSVVLIVTGFVLSTRRDVGAGLRATRRGRSGAPAWLSSPLALAWRLHRGSVRGWAIGLVAGGLVYGATTQPVADSFSGEDNAVVELWAGGAEDIIAGYLNMMVVLMVITTGVFVVLAAGKVRAEESDGRAAPVLATAVSRPAWLAGHVLTIAVAAVVLLLLSGAGIGLAAAVGTGDWSMLSQSLIASLAYSPALLVILGVAAAGYGLHPRLLTLASVLLAFGGFAAVFGEMLQLPDWALAISPWQHTASYPLESVTAAPLLVQGLVALVLAALGIWAFGRRDLRSA
ncbi:ABC transporter permease [Ruania albidiflava]|uniref:ABC transporter permease n=1 Tax=Ruania albidiflava TaxID=366586 RepID=UPI0003B6C0B7|nr:ABC transporter permease [Ruania albidiflava]